MKATVRLPIDAGMQVLVSVGDKIDSQTDLLGLDKVTTPYIIPVSKVLHIQPSEMTRYLKVKPGETVDINTILARKKSLLSACTIKSPVKGVFQDMDLKNGSITIVETSKEGKGKVRLPIKGKVKEVSKSFLELEVEGEVFRGKEGQGNDAYGNLTNIRGESIGILDINGDVDELIVMGKNILPETVVKLEVMGAKGVIVETVLSDSRLPWLLVDAETAGSLKSHVGKRIWLNPRMKQIVAFN